MNTLSMLLSDSQTANDKLIKRILNQLHCACVGIVTSVNFDEQTLEAIPATKIKVINKDFEESEVNLPLIVDIPFMFPKSGKYSITMPIEIGDECLLIFTDTDFSAWWQSGEIQSPQTAFKHHLSNAIAIVGISSLKTAVNNYNPNAIEIRNADASEKISLSAGNITLKSATITLDGNITVTGTSNLQGSTTIQDKEFLSHIHSNGNQGANTGGVQ